MITENTLYHINNVHRQQNYIGLVYGVLSLVKSSLENQPYYNLESIFRAFNRKEMKALRRLAENDIITVLLASSLAKGYDPLYSSSPLASLVGFS
jgi:hypothetical protein